MRVDSKLQNPTLHIEIDRRTEELMDNENPDVGDALSDLQNQFGSGERTPRPKRLVRRLRR